MASRKNRKWFKGMTGWVCYSYKGGGGTVRPVTVAESEDKRGYVTVDMGGFHCLCWRHQIHDTEAGAEAVRVALKEQEEDDDADN